MKIRFYSGRRSKMLNCQVDKRLGFPGAVDTMGGPSASVALTMCIAAEPGTQGTDGWIIINGKKYPAEVKGAVWENCFNPDGTKKRTRGWSSYEKREVWRYRYIGWKMKSSKRNRKSCWKEVLVLGVTKNYDAIRIYVIMPGHPFHKKVCKWTQYGKAFEISEVEVLKAGLKPVFVRK